MKRGALASAQANDDRRLGEGDWTEPTALTLPTDVQQAISPKSRFPIAS
jgi:hypothetical protein